MGYIFISSKDKTYSKKTLICLIQKGAYFFIVAFPFMFIFLYYLFDLFTKNIIFASLCVLVVFFLSFTVENIFARKISGITMKDVGFFKEHKHLKSMLVDYFLMLFSRSGRPVYVEKNFDGFKKEIVYNTVTSFYIFVIILLFFYNI